MNITLRDRYRGCLLGLAVGDAIGTTIEFSPPGTFAPITDMVGGGPFHLAAGQWTDDTSMALCMAASLIEKQRFDPKDQMDRYVRWYREGYMSCTGSCFDIGGTTARALRRYESDGNPFAGSLDGGGNGCLMRLAPAPMAYAADPMEAIRISGESARLTHGLPAAIAASQAFGGMIVSALSGDKKSDVLSKDKLEAMAGEFADSWRLQHDLYEVISGSYRTKEPPAIRGAGYVVKALEAALWAFDRGEDYADVVLRAANLGDDADTTAAIAGQLAGAFYGVQGIPERWLKKLAMREQIDEFAVRLFELAEQVATPPSGVGRNATRQ